MSKLRLIQERTDEIEVATDLRGLGETEIMRDSSPYACLIVSGMPASGDKSLKSVAAAYGLKVQPGTSVGDFQLMTPTLHAGEHKSQAVTLFVAALELARNHSKASFLLTEVSRLHQALHNSIHHGGKNKRDLLHERVDAWKATAGVDGKAHIFYIDTPVVSHLHTAGFEFKNVDHAAVLTRTDLHKHHELLSAKVSNGAPLRKAA